MRSKWYLLSLLILTVLIVSIGAISAADNISNTVNTSEDSENVVSNQDIVDSVSINQGNSISDNVVGESNNKSNLKSSVIVNNQAEFEAILNDSTINNTIIYLNNQSFTSLKFDYIYNRNLTICGGKDLNDNLRSTIINADFTRGRNNSFNFNRINFINSSAGASEGNFIADDCVFKDNNKFEGSLSFYYSNVTIKNCKFLNITSTSFLEGSNLTVVNTTFDNNHCYVPFFYCTSSSKVLFDNCTIENNSFYDFNNDMYRVSFILNNGGSESEIILNNSRINNNNGSIVKVCATPDRNSDSYKSTVLVDNCVFSNNNKSTIKIYFRNNNVTVVNSLFENNTGECGAAIYSGRGNLNVINTSFINNSALYGGAIYSTRVVESYDDNYTNLNVNNCSFINNSASVSGGAICFASNNTNISNSIFDNNKAFAFAGAILSGDCNISSISNNVFTDNYGNDYGNDIFYYNTTLILSNNGNPNIYCANDSSLKTWVDVNEEDFSFLYVTENSTVLPGFCLEQHMPFLDGSNFMLYLNNTNIALNSINHKYVGDYVKYLIYNYYGKIPNQVLAFAIWAFTDGNYEDSNFLEDMYNALNFSYLGMLPFRYDKYHAAEIGAGVAINRFSLMDVLRGSSEEDLDTYISVINDTLNSVKNGFVIPDYGATKLNDNGTYTVYNFTTIFTQDYQNLILFDLKDLNSSPSSDFNVTKITNDLIVYKGNDTSFDILVTNNGTLMLSNVTVTEDSFDDLTYKSWISLNRNWTYNYVNGKHTWTLIGYLGVNETASFKVVFSTENTTVGEKINTVIVSTNGTGNKTTNNTTTVENYSFTVIKEALTSVVYKGNDTIFRITVTNDGTLNLTNVTVKEVSFDDLIYKSWSTVTGDWVYNDDLTWTINELAAGESASFDVTFDTSSAAAGNKINTVIVTTNETGNKTANNTTTVIENITNNTNSSTNETNETNDTGYSGNEEVIAKEDVKTTEITGYPFIALIIALIGIIGTGFRKK